MVLARADDHPGLRPGGFAVGLTGGAFARKQTSTKADASTSSASNEKPPPFSSGVSHTTNSSTSSSTSSSSPWPEVRRVLRRCLSRAGSGGLPGAAAGVLQVLMLMWMRTVINYQYRYGASLGAAISELYRQGGVLRFYQGVSFALVSNPLSRFGMAAANEGAMALRDALPWPMSVAFTTWLASLLAGAWRMMLTPLDTCKTVLQVEGSKGFALLMAKVREINHDTTLLLLSSCLLVWLSVSYHITYYCSIYVPGTPGMYMCVHVVNFGRTMNRRRLVISHSVSTYIMYGITAGGRSKSSG